MAPKHGLTGTAKDETNSKRAKSSAQSRSATPANDGAGSVPFTVVYPDMQKTHNTPAEQDLVNGAELQKSPFVAKGALKDRELDQYYTVTPRKEWESMKKYSNFIIQGDTYKNDQVVFVRGENTPDTKDPEGRQKDFWVAKVLQVRAKDQQHVYALVTWLYWPEELPPPDVRHPDQITRSSGKRKYHGSHELIASNYMEVLDVLSFAGKADVLHWLEEDDNLTHKLFWRQTYSRQTKALSKLRSHCICNGYFNPEIAMYICDNAACKVWLHPECLIDSVLSAAYEGLEGNNSTAKSNGRSSKNIPRYKNKLRAKLLEVDGLLKAQITDLRARADPRTWTENINCPKCDAALQG